MKTVGEKLKELIEIRDITQLELAQRSGLTPALISMLLNGKSKDIMLNTAKSLAVALGVHPAYFIIDEVLGPADILPHMTEEQKDFVLKSDSLPWIKLSQEAAEKGVSPETVKKVIELIVSSYVEK